MMNYEIFLQNGSKAKKILKIQTLIRTVLRLKEVKIKKNPQTEGKTIQFVDVDTDVCSLMVRHYFASFSK